MIVDSHCHLDCSKLYNQLDQVVRRAEYNQVKYLLTICTTLESFEKIKLIVVKYKNIGEVNQLKLTILKWINQLLESFKGRIQKLLKSGFPKMLDYMRQTQVIN